MRWLVGGILPHLPNPSRPERATHMDRPGTGGRLADSNQDVRTGQRCRSSSPRWHFMATTRPSRFMKRCQRFVWSGIPAFIHPWRCNWWQHIPREQASSLFPCDNGHSSFGTCVSECICPEQQRHRRPYHLGYGAWPAARLAPLIGRLRRWPRSFAILVRSVGLGCLGFVALSLFQVKLHEKRRCSHCPLWSPRAYPLCLTVPLLKSNDSAGGGTLFLCRNEMSRQRDA